MLVETDRALVAHQNAVDLIGTSFKVLPAGKHNINSMTKDSYDRYLISSGGKFVKVKGKSNIKWFCVQRKTYLCTFMVVT